MAAQIRVIDLFAGPGGLGEGFSAYQDENGDFPFQIVASVEKEKSAHDTLTLRAFFRQFRGGEVPQAYYDYIQAGGTEDLEVAFNEYTDLLDAAKRETLHGPKALGSSDHKAIFDAIKESIKGFQGQKIVIGGPPCQAYSLAGRVRNKGNKEYIPELDNRHFLYQEYLKVLDLVEPEIFVMENVKGILTAKVNGGSIFETILSDLHCPSRTLNKKPKAKYDIYPFAVPASDDMYITGYRGKGPDFIIRTEEFGIPQTRHRVILLGIKKNLGIEFDKNKSLLEEAKRANEVTVSQVISDLPKLRSGITKVPNTTENWLNNYRKSLKIVKKHLPSEYNLLAKEIENPLSIIHTLTQGDFFIEQKKPRKSQLPKELKKWYLDKRMKGVANHSSRSHMASDIQRYLFASAYAQLNNGQSPRAKDYPETLFPDHKNWESGHFVDRFKVQAGNRAGKTVTSHISKDGHYFIHYDPIQCRSLTVREAARIQTFPDNYFFKGNRTEQFVQVGNAVPPLLANKLAKVVWDLLLSRT
ncbi:DNA cytosine methyltransferase [Saccharospirillum alexandrii]|uniref:DNA cytosine methyltransferase n=1 Tax=Saccharospirillum alexandrii TaxID=2448477 RepID=UPI003736160F